MQNLNEAIFKRFKPILVLLPIIFSLLADVFPASPAPTNTILYNNTAKTEEEFLTRINRERKKRGLPPLRSDGVLNRVSLQHSLKMAEKEELSHTFPAYQSLGERLREAGIIFRKAGENIAYCKSYLLEEVHDGFMESPPHRENILNPNFTHCSIKIVRKKQDIYITQEFAQLVTPLREYGIAPEIEKDLASWYKERFKSRLTLLPTVRNFAEFCAEENLNGRTLPGVNEKWGHFYIVNVIAEDMEHLKKELKKKARFIKFKGAAVGAVVGAHARYPGGVYSLTALLFPGNKYIKKSDAQLTEYVLEEVNGIRRHYGCRSLKYNKTLSQKALETAQLHYNSPEDSLGYPYAQKVRIFKGNAPHQIPPEHKDFLAAKKQSGKIGIGVFSPLKYGLPGDFFIVAIIVDTV